jgi:hypothetical protein
LPKLIARKCLVPSFLAAELATTFSLWRKFYTTVALTLVEVAANALEHRR